jgi:DNA topoisomerase VI subunit B
MAGEGDRLIVRVVDRGPGIPPAQLERVFEPFYSAGTARGGRRGSGLGLAIARGFLEANGGSLHVESLPGQGATFVFELPLERGGLEAEAAVAARGVEAAEATRGLEAGALPRAQGAPAPAARVSEADGN